ncbi:M10 family metallopeptidase C-terminal domain-containing protein [Desmonostoc muscorum LEGE 12446]|uniref:M10 family metallopeptidase C-terminal domain-containing protein n=1 Tax=Desmonostoc muscorum LEGE 12446 TaxID=1828758 RepID=A0A8J7A1M1_DESMC|nr:M10 family metallopeptidase C-terminal domain-containing protein [Desmonostoc muscorum]MCF2151527.1 M10 family metallopeptidase C-terminal domain-containing protein [Desmonostoc muscorum LEGE 12446]
MSPSTKATISADLIPVTQLQLEQGRADAYGGTTSVTNTTKTNVNNIDGLLIGTEWLSNTVTFSFTSSFTNDYEDESGYPDSVVHASSFQTLNATQRAVARQWFDMYESVSGLNMVELTGASDRDATIRIAESNDPGTAYAYYPGNSVAAGDVWFNTSDYNNPVIGNYAYHTFGHEFGHALGLKHGHETGGISNVAMDANRDSMEFSIMTYRSYVGDPLSGGYSNETWGYAQSLMMYDIRAIQQMYGANFNHNSGNTTYTFSTTTGEMFVNGIGQGTPGGNRIFRTIWDGNGIDTYNFSNYTTNLAINLEPGNWTNLNVGGNFQRANLGDGNYARGHVFNALQFNGDTRSLIENANGGSGNDNIKGNSANNVLRGNGGNDTISGGGGDDYMDGGAGVDTVDYTHWSGGGTYNLSTGVASFPGFYNEEILNFENILTGGGNDNIIGSGANNRIIAGAGNDTVSGGGGDDYMDGGAGVDTIDYTHWSGGGTYNLGTGVASFPGFYNEEILNFENILTGGGNDNIIGSGANNRIVAGAGNDTIVGGLGNDTLTGNAGADHFRFRSLSDGVDRITDFSVLNDTIDVSAAGFGGGLVAGAFITSAQFVIGAVATDAFDRFIYNSTSGALSFDRDGSLGTFNQFQIATLSAGLAMTNNDIFVIA